MSIIHLDDTYFSLDVSSRILLLKMIEPTLVFFKLLGCKGCNAVEKHFIELAKSDNRVKYATIDISRGNNKEVTRLSRQSSTPIESVPHFILYVQGRPKARVKNGTDITSYMGLAELITSVFSRQTAHNTAIASPPSSQFVQQTMYAPPKYIGGQPHEARYQSPPDISPSTEHTSLKHCSPDDPNCLTMPQDLFPHNMPWERKFRELES